MKIMLDIPAAFEKEWEKDRFESSLRRLAADAHLLAGRFERETADMLVQAFRDGQAVPPEKGGAKR